MRVSGHSRHFDAKDTNGGKLAKSIGRVGILRDGTRVTVRQVERVLSKVPEIVAVSWHDRSGSGAQVYRLVDGRMILAGFCQLTDETVEVSTPRKKAIVEESVEESDDSVLSTETDAVEEPEEIAELTLPRFSSVAALEDAEVPDTQPGEESEDSGEEVEEETEVA